MAKISTYPFSSQLMIHGLAQLRDEKLLCDVELVAENETFPVHRVVLAAASPYFKAMFTGGFKETAQNLVTLKETSAKGLKCILDAIYSCKLTLTEANVEHVLSVASLLQMKDAEAACENFLSENINENNCVTCLLLAEKYELKGAMKTSNEFTLENFEKVVPTSQFLKLSQEKLCKFISDDRLRLPSGEIEVFRAAVKWIMDKSNENIEPPEVLRYVRYPQIPAELLTDEVLKISMMYQWTELRELVLGALKFHGNIFTQPFQDEEQYKPRGEQKLLVISGGTRETNSYSVQEDNSQIHVLDPEALFSKEDDRFEAPFAFAYRSMCAVAMNNYMFLFGTLSKSFNPIAMRFDGATMKWTNLQTPPFRATVGSAVARQQNDVYFTGGMLVTPSTTGYDTSKITSEAWKYAVAQNSWKAEPSLPRPLAYHAMASHGGFIFVAGGVSGHERMEATADLYAFDVAGKLWLTKAKMQNARHGHCLEVVDEKIYAVGGINGNVEVYSIAEDQWTQLGDISMLHCFFSQTVAVNSKLYILGGWTNGPCDLVSCFDPKEKEASSMPDLPFKCSGGISALLTLPRK